MFSIVCVINATVNQDSRVEVDLGFVTSFRCDGKSARLCDLVMPPEA